MKGTLFRLKGGKKKKNLGKYIKLGAKLAGSPSVDRKMPHKAERSYRFATCDPGG